MLQLYNDVDANYYFQQIMLKKHRIMCMNMVVRGVENTKQFMPPEWYEYYYTGVILWYY